MQEKVAAEIAQALAGRAQVTETRERLQVQRAVQLLPEPEGWRLAEGQVAAYILAERILFTVIWRVGENPMLTLTRRPLDVHDAVVRLDWEGEQITQAGALHKTHWIFRFGAGDETQEVRIDGTVQTMPSASIDDDERFARLLASRVGFTAALLEGQDVLRLN